MMVRPKLTLPAIKQWAESLPDDRVLGRHEMRTYGASYCGSCLVSQYLQDQGYQDAWFNGHSVFLDFFSRQDGYVASKSVRDLAERFDRLKILAQTTGYTRADILPLFEKGQ
jgi:hypothetical protein